VVCSWLAGVFTTVERVKRDGQNRRWQCLVQRRRCTLGVNTRGRMGARTRRCIQLIRRLCCLAPTCCMKRYAFRCGDRGEEIRPAQKHSSLLCCHQHSSCELASTPLSLRALPYHQDTTFFPISNLVIFHLRPVTTSSAQQRSQTCLAMLGSPLENALRNANVLQKLCSSLSSAPPGGEARFGPWG
jgi:hypothetical protein